MSIHLFAGGRIEMRITMSEAQWDKLQSLAHARTTRQRAVTPEQCLLDFIDAAQPGGSGWKHPSSPTNKSE